jgi:hypothetical protein
MTLDPSDDCTFWYTQEYIKTNGNTNWSTRIANFKFPSCGVVSGGGVATLSTSLLTFNKTPIGQTTSSLTVTLTNTGSATLNIFDVSASGDYLVSGNTCGSSVAQGATCAFSVTFTPTKKGARNGVLTIADDAADSPQSVTLKGMGQSLALSPTSLNFGTIAVGTTSSPQDVTVTNVGTTPVTITGYSFTGGGAVDYLISGNTCGATLTPAATCVISLEFMPTKKATRNASFNVKNNGGGGSSNATVTGIGN